MAAFAAVAIGAGALGGVAGGLVMSDRTVVADTGLATSTQSVANTTTSASTVAQIAKSVSPSVVEINVSTYAGRATGSGVVLSAGGRILTNNHVISAAANGGTITVTFNDGSKARASIVGTDPSSDLAVIQAEGVSGLTAAKLGDSSKVQVGDQVVAIGSPEGLQGTVTSGIVSALNREVTVGSSDPTPNGPFSRTSSADQSVTYHAIQTDASLNPGNSGGPLINAAGEVIGINSAIYSPASSSSESGSVGLGFAIPINQAKTIIDRIEAGGTS